MDLPRDIEISVEERAEGAPPTPNVKAALAMLVQSIRLAPMRLPIARIEFRGDGDHVHMRVVSKVIDRDGGVEPIRGTWTNQDSHFLCVANLSEDDRKPVLCRWVYEQVRMALLHELDECFCVDGVRVRDPHRGAP